MPRATILSDFAAMIRLPRPNKTESVFEPSIRPVLAAIRFPTLCFENIVKSGAFIPYALLESTLPFQGQKSYRHRSRLRQMAIKSEPQKCQCD